VALYAFVVALDESGQTVRDRVVSLVVHSVAVLVFGLLVLVVGFPLWGGFKSLVHANFYTQDLRQAGPLAPITIGGLQHAVIGTLEQITITLAILVIAFIKIRYVILDFMEIRRAPLPMRIAAEIWVVAVCTATVLLYTA